MATVPSTPCDAHLLPVPYSRPRSLSPSPLAPESYLAIIPARALPRPAEPLYLCLRLLLLRFQSSTVDDKFSSSFCLTAGDGSKVRPAKERPSLAIIKTCLPGPAPPGGATGRQGCKAFSTPQGRSGFGEGQCHSIPTLQMAVFNGNRPQPGLKTKPSGCL